MIASKLAATVDAREKSVTEVDPIVMVEPDSLVCMAAERTFSNMVKLALADDGLAKGEKTFLIKWARSNGIADDRIKELFAEARQDKSKPQTHTRGDLIVLIGLALSDGVLSVKELKYLLACGARIGISADDVKQTVLAVQSGRLAADPV